MKNTLMLALGEAFKHNASIRIIDVYPSVISSYDQAHHSCLSRKSIKRWTHALKLNQTLIHVELKYCGLGPDSAASIADILLNNHAIQTLILSIVLVHHQLAGNFIGSKGWDSIGTAVAKSRLLRKLVVGICANCKARLQQHGG